MSKADDLFLKEFGAILAFLVAFAMAMFFLARGIGSASFERSQQAPKTVAARIAPIGQVRLAGDADSLPALGASEQAAGGETGSAAGVVAAPTATETAERSASTQPAPDSSEAAQPGDQVYKAACVACHATGVAGAPKVGDAAAWEPRMQQGIDALVHNAVTGKGAMPAKGGNAALSEADIRSAVEFMLAGTGLSVTVDEAAPSGGSGDTEQTTAGAQVAGSVGAGEQIYSTACIACHATGTAGAPKVGDDAAWKSRAEQGIDTLVRNAVSGVGAMPAKGGNTTLSDEDVRNAVLFMLEQSGVSG